MKRQVLCFGDSNTFGYCADPNDCADGTHRYNEDARWTCLLGGLLGDGYHVIEEGLSGRTTVFSDPLHESMDALGAAYATLMSHEPLDLLIIMLGTNDTKERFAANAAAIAVGMERLLKKCKSIECWGGRQPNILVVCPPPIGDGFRDEVMGEGCVEKSRALPAYLKPVAERNGAHFFDARDCEFNPVDHMHLSRKGHAQLAEALAALVPTLI